MVKHSQRRSTGDMISTICFAGMSAKFTFDALGWEGGPLGLVLIIASAVACFLAALRFRLQALIDIFKR